jgi:hypothetical protein
MLNGTILTAVMLSRAMLIAFMLSVATSPFRLYNPKRTEALIDQNKLGPFMKHKLTHLNVKQVRFYLPIQSFYEVLLSLLGLNGSNSGC